MTTESYLVPHAWVGADALVACVHALALGVRVWFMRRRALQRDVSCVGPGGAAPNAIAPVDGGGGEREVGGRRGVRRGGLDWAVGALLVHVPLLFGAALYMLIFANPFASKRCVAYKHTCSSCCVAFSRQVWDRLNTACLAVMAIAAPPVLEAFAARDGAPLHESPIAALCHMLAHGLATAWALVAVRSTSRRFYADADLGAAGLPLLFVALLSAQAWAAMSRQRFAAAVGEPSISDGGRMRTLRLLSPAVVPLWAGEALAWVSFACVTQHPAAFAQLPWLLAHAVASASEMLRAVRKQTSLL